MSNHLDGLIHKQQQITVHEKFIQVLKKTYNLPDCLPPFPMLPKVVEALEVLSNQYPNDVQILQKLVYELKEENKRLSSS